MSRGEGSFYNYAIPRGHRATTAILVIILCLLTLGVRVGYAAFFPIQPIRDEWDHIAANLANGLGYVSSWPKTYISPATLNLPDYNFPLIPTATRVPVPVIYFALMYRLFGFSAQSLIIGQWILDILTCVLLFMIALKIFGDRRVAALTSAAWAIYVPELSMANSRYAEPMIAFLLACLAYVLVVAISTHSMWQFGLAGVVGGLATLSRPTLAVLPLFLFPVLVVLFRRQLRLAILACGVITLGGVLIISPWAYRNFKVYGAFVPTSTLGGLIIFRDHYLMDRDDYLVFRDYYTVEAACKEVLDRRFGSVAVVEMADNTQLLIDRTYREEALAKIWQYPGRYLVLCLVRLFRLWFNIGYGASPSWRSYLILIGHLTLLGLFVKALVSYRGAWLTRIAPILAMLVHHTLGFMAIVSDFRYSVPLAPYLIMVGSYTLVCFFEENRSKIIGKVLPRLTTKDQTG